MTTATETTPEASNAVTREDFETIAKIRYGYHELPNGKRIIFSSLRRSVLYAIDSQFFTAEGKSDEARMRERPARMLTAVLCDAQGNRMFREDEWERVDAIKKTVFEPLWTAVRKHLGFEEETEATEEAADSPND